MQVPCDGLQYFQKNSYSLAFWKGARHLTENEARAVRLTMVDGRLRCFPGHATQSWESDTMTECITVVMSADPLDCAVLRCAVEPWRCGRGVCWRLRAG